MTPARPGHDAVGLGPCSLYSLMQSFHRRWWGNPLNAALTTLPTGDNAQEVSDLLPRDAFLQVDEEIRLLIRAEYLRVFDEVTAVYNHNKRRELAVVTGQPGIGKTWWIFYALRRCLGEKRPVTWYKEDMFFGFGASGVTINEAYSGWCFVDSEDARDTLPPKICSVMDHFFPIYVTDPQASRWRKLDQSGRHPSVVIMDPWTWPEMEKAAPLYPANFNALPDVRARFLNTGPVPRHCLIHNPRIPEEFYWKRELYLTRVLDSAAAYEKLTLDGLRLSLDDGAETVCLVRRATSEDMDRGWGHTVDPITEGVRCRMREEMERWGQGEILSVIRQLCD